MDTIVQSDCVEFCNSLGAESVDLIFTSPPYSQKPRSYENSDPIKADDYVGWFLPKIAAFKRVLKPTGSFVLNISDSIVDGEIHPFLDELKTAIRKEFRYLEDFLWVKTNPVPNAPVGYRPLRVYEHCFWFSKTKDYHWYADQIRKPYSEGTLARYNREYNVSGTSSLYFSEDKAHKNVKYAGGEMEQDWNGVKPNPLGASPANIVVGSKYSGRSLGHPAVFPEYLPKFFIESMTKPGDIVLDPFMGSGTTAVVCQKLDRHFLGCDASQVYVDIALKRLQENNQKEMVE
jgi:site-specific DNA-methyltransferase (adenine-specific)/site-specific DNA-methyltransferase (cytosine-N4-specific)